MATKLETTSLVDAVTFSVRNEILTGRIAPGLSVTEKLVSTEYEVARPTAKAALERLVHQGLLRRVMHKAAQVPLMTVGDVRDLYFSRTLLECRVVGMLARDRSVPAEAIKALQTFDTAIEDPSLTGIVDADVAFHVALVDALGSMRVSRMHAVVMGEAHLCMAQVQAHKLVSARTIAKEHQGIVRAIRSGDSALAERRAAEHLGRARDNLIDYLTPKSRESSEAVQ